LSLFLQASALHIAVVLGNIGIAKQLLEAGANHSCQNHMGMTPLQLALANQRTEMAALLQQYNATLQASHAMSATAASTALWNAEGATGLADHGVTPEDVTRVRASWAFVSSKYHGLRVWCRML
jgi:ankyrin repeat protein